jgi:hypothetical protein
MIGDGHATYPLNTQGRRVTSYSNHQFIIWHLVSDLAPFVFDHNIPLAPWRATTWRRNGRLDSQGLLFKVWLLALTGSDLLKTYL